MCVSDDITKYTKLNKHIVFNWKTIYTREINAIVNFWWNLCAVFHLLNVMAGTISGIRIWLRCKLIVCTLSVSFCIDCITRQNAVFNLMKQNVYIYELIALNFPETHNKCKQRLMTVFTYFLPQLYIRFVLGVFFFHWYRVWFAINLFSRRVTHSVEIHATKL